MKKIIGLLFLLSISMPAVAGGNFGAGFMIGEPTGFSFKLWTAQKTALDFGVGWGSSWSGNNYGYYDGSCYDGAFYKNNKGYCQSQLYSGPDRYYGWSNFHVHGDYLFHNFNLIKSHEKFPLYYGPGLAFDYWRGGYYYPDFNRNGGFVQVGARGVIGIAWMPRSSPFDIFLEVAPVFEFYPFTDLRMNASFGSRFYF